MSTKSKIVLVAAFVFGTASAALADEHFDVNIFRSVPQSPAFATYMGGLSAFAQVPGKRIQVSPTVEEARLFARGSYAGH
jgi:hypothetical protein